MVSTPLKNIGQNGNLPLVGVNIKNIWNHHLVFVCLFLKYYLQPVSIWPALHVHTMSQSHHSPETFEATYQGAHWQHNITCHYKQYLQITTKYPTVYVYVRMWLCMFCRRPSIRSTLRLEYQKPFVGNSLEVRGMFVATHFATQFCHKKPSWKIRWTFAEISL